MRLTGAGYSSATFTPDTIITQTTGTGVTAIGKVISYDQITGVLKYWQDRTMAGFTTVGAATTTPIYGFNADRFTADVSEWWKCKYNRRKHFSWYKHKLSMVCQPQ